MAHRAKVVAVHAGSGGIGKTTVAVNVAVSLQQQANGRALFIDAGHPVPGGASRWFGLDRAKALGDMVPLLSRLTVDSFAAYLVSAPSGVSVLPLVSDVLQVRLLTPDVVQRALDLAVSAFDVIVMDMPTGQAPVSNELFEYADAVCVVSDDTLPNITRARHCFDYLRSLQVPSDALLLCLNRILAPDQGQVDRLERVVGVPVAAVLPEDPDPVMQAEARGLPFVNAYPRHAIARSIDRLARVIATRGDQSDRRAVSLDIDLGHDERLIALKMRIHQRLVDEIDLRKTDLSYLKDPVKLQEVRTRAEAKILALVDEEAEEVTSRELRRRLVKDLLDEALGLGPLEDLLADPAVTEIMVNRPDQIYVERNGRLQLTPVRFLNQEQLRGVIERIVAPIGRRIDEKTPMVDARLRDGSRVNAIIPPLAVHSAAITIRKFSKRLLGMQDLIGFGSLTSQMASFLEASVLSRQNIVISGGTGSGKTTLLNVLSAYIPADERIVTIEDAAELQLPQDHVITLESRPANIEGEGAVTIRDLVRNSLRMRPDRIVVGECRGGEALDMLQAMNTGHDGSLTTVHANTPRDALSRLETMSLMAGLDLPARAIRDQIASAVNFVVQQTRMQDGTRRVTYISELVAGGDGEFVTRDVFLFQQAGLSPDGRVLGQFVPTGHVPAFVDALGRRGIRLPREIFLHQTV